jgi:peptidoglycan-associated lipoprotein
MAVAAPAPATTSAVKQDDTQKRMAEQAEAARKAEAEYQQAAQAALKDVHFGFNHSDIMEADKPVLTAIAAFMKQYPQANVFIDGNCDERGTVEYNLGLGERRAHAAMAYLVGLGVPASRLSMTSYGKEKPVCVESIESCWVRNRRAHFSLLK